MLVLDTKYWDTSRYFPQKYYIHLRVNFKLKIYSSLKSVQFFKKSYAFQMSSSKKWNGVLNTRHCPTALTEKHFYGLNISVAQLFDIQWYKQIYGDFIKPYRDEGHEYFSQRAWFYTPTLPFTRLCDLQLSSNPHGDNNS